MPEGCPALAPLPVDRRVLQPTSCVVIQGDEFAIARDQIPNQGGLAALPRPRNHDDRCVLERGGHQFGGKAGKERVIGIVHAGWKLRLIRIDGSSISDYRLV